MKISLQDYLKLKLKKKTSITYENIIARLSETHIKEKKLPLHMKISLQGYLKLKLKKIPLHTKISLQGYLKLKLKKKNFITYENIIARLSETQIKEENFHYI
jgi:hypothetical protein